jgi:putative redox protein
MAHEVNCNWKGEMAFKADIDEYSVSMDADQQFGGQGEGPKPKPLLLASLAGCTGMDVVSLLNKMRVEFDDLQINVSGELTDEHPKYYHKIHLVYTISGSNLNQAKVEKAINLSQDRYCGVSAMLKKAAQLTYEIEYREQVAAKH